MLRFLSLKDAANRLGMTQTSVKTLVRHGKIKAYRVPGSQTLRIVNADVDEYLRTHPPTKPRS